jgi:chromosome segregation ATPase
MTQNYENLLQDMFSAKKDFNQLRVRNAQIECTTSSNAAELKYVREEANELRSQNDKLAREKHSLEIRVRGLEGQLDQLRTSYEATVQSIKADVDSRQTEIQSARGIGSVT